MTYEENVSVRDLGEVYDKLADDLIQGSVAYYSQLAVCGGVRHDDFVSFLYRAHIRYDEVRREMISQLDNITERAAASRRGLVVEAALLLWKGVIHNNFNLF